MTTQNGNLANHLFACTVDEYDAGNGKKAKTSTPIGAAFPHTDGTGFNVQLQALPIEGRIVLLPPDSGGTASEQRNKARWIPA